MTKPRSDAKLLNLPEEQQAQLAEWLLGGTPYHEARALVKKEFGIETSLGALSHFFQTVCTAHLIRRRQQAVGVADEIAREAQSNPGRFDAATVDALRQKALELAIAPMAAPRDVKALFTLLQKHRDQELKAETLKLDREKFEFNAAEQALAALSDLQQIARNPSLDERAKITAIRQRLFGQLPEEKAANQ